MNQVSSAAHLDSAKLGSNQNLTNVQLNQPTIHHQNDDDDDDDSILSNNIAAKSAILISNNQLGVLGTIETATARSAGPLAIVANRLAGNPLVSWLLGLTKSVCSIFCTTLARWTISGWRPAHCCAVGCRSNCANNNMDYWCRRARGRPGEHSMISTISELDIQDKFEDCRGGEEANAQDHLLTINSPITSTPGRPLHINATPPATGPKPHPDAMDALLQLGLSLNNKNNNYLRQQALQFSQHHTNRFQEPPQQQQQQQQTNINNNNNNINNNNNNNNTPARHRFVLVDESSLGELKNELAHYVDKVRNMEQQIRVIPDLERRLDEMATIQSQSLDSMNWSHEVLSLLSGPISTISSLQASLASQRRLGSQNDAATNTEISMSDIVTRAELDSLVSGLRLDNSSETCDRQLGSSGSSGALSPSQSSSASNRSSSSQRNQQTSSSNNERHLLSTEDEDDDNLPAGELQSLGSSCQDPSDFEEYRAYGETLDRRTKDFLSKSTKIPNEFRFALMKLSDHLTPTTHSRCDQASSPKTTKIPKLPVDPLNDECLAESLDCVRRYWFEVVSAAPLKATTTTSTTTKTNDQDMELNKRNQQVQLEKARFYLGYFESFNKQLVNAVVNLADRAGNTAMHYASSDLRLGLMRLLLDTHLCDLNKRNRAGYTPLMLLALVELDQEAEELARRLFGTGDPNIKCKSRAQTALMLAASHGRVNTCRLLLECGADPSLKDTDGSTALMCASEFGHYQIVRCLLQDRRTDPAATDNDGLDALTIALNNNHRGVALLLFSANNVPARSLANHHQLDTTFTLEAGKDDRPRRARGQAYLTSSLRK